MSYLTDQLKSFEYPQAQTQAEIDAAEQANALMDEAAAEIERYEKLIEQILNPALSCNPATGKIEMIGATPLRDQFAIAAMSSTLLSAIDSVHGTAEDMRNVLLAVSTASYKIADAMLIARDKT